MKAIGIWIDKKEAKLITLENEKEKFQTITSDIESFAPKGGSGTAAKGGPQDVVQDSKYLEREKHQFTGYFKSIIPHLEDKNVVVIFGPAQTGEKLFKEIEKKHPHIVGKIKSVEKADNMTDNQLVAWVKNFFQSDK